MGKVELKLEVDEELLARARARGAQPQQVLEDALRVAADRSSLIEGPRGKAGDPDEALRRAREWEQTNKEAIAEHNAWVAEHGSFGETWRSW